VKALTIRQPWAYAIAVGRKDVENRTRRTHHRGEVAIHSALTVDPKASIDPIDVNRTLFVRGAVLAVAEIVGCCDCGDRCTPWSQRGPGIFHWQLANVRALTPIPAKGALGLWTLPYEVEQAVRGQLAGDLTWGEMVQDFSRAFNPRGGPPTRTPDHPNATPTGEQQP
jgi:hypothetical protein